MAKTNIYKLNYLNLRWYMDFLFIMGASGTGKSTLAKKLAAEYPERFNRIVQYSTRKKRADEVEDVDYHFITEEEYKNLSSTLMARSVMQFAPTKYGTPIMDLNRNKINVIVVSIEGLLNAITSLAAAGNNIFILNIRNDVDCDAVREGRNANIEDTMNMAALQGLCSRNNSLRNFNKWGTISMVWHNLQIKYMNIMLSELKEVRDKKDELADFLSLKDAFTL